jgi:adenylate cyclase
MKQVFGAHLPIIAGAALPRIVLGVSIAGAVASIWGALPPSIFADDLPARLLYSAAGTGVLAVGSMISYAMSRHRAALMRRRFDHELAPAVVRRILEKPPKTVGERREITALFTDVEGFSAMTRNADGTTLLKNLNVYFEGMATIVVAHGGVIDKIVGDGIHAFFNATRDLEDHPRKAIECAIALRSWAEEFRHRPAPFAIGFGRTRIGIEAGPAIVGDIGVRAKLDYTAHGDAVNIAARLEYANKELGSSICVGPVAASCCDNALLRPLGRIIVHGRSESLPVFEPWPSDAPNAWRESYLTAMNLYHEDPVGAADSFDRLATDQIDDEASRVIASRMRYGGWQ